MNEAIGCNLAMFKYLGSVRLFQDLVPTFGGGNANISEPNRTARRKRQYKRTEPHSTATNSSAPLSGNEACD